MRTHSLERLENAKDQQVLPGWAGHTPEPARTGAAPSSLPAHSPQRCFPSARPIDQDGRANRSSAWRGLTVPAQQGRRLGEDVPETPVGEQSYQPRQDPDWTVCRSIGRWTWCRSTVTSRLRQVSRTSWRTRQNDRYRNERVIAGCSLHLAPRGQTAVHRPRMAFSAPKVRQGNDEQESK